MRDFWDNLADTNTWAAHYGEKVNLHTYNFITRRNGVLSLLGENEVFGRILDIGCGTGDFGLLGERHDGTFFGVDYSPGMIAKAVDRYGSRGRAPHFLVGSGEKIPFEDESFDLVLGIGYIEYFRQPEIPINEIKRVLKPGGTLILQSFKWDLFGNIRRYVTDPVRSLIGKPNNRKEKLPDDWFDKKYSQPQLDNLLKPFGFNRIGYNFNNFMPFNLGMVIKYPQLYIRISEAMGRTGPGFWRFLALNYIGKYKLTK